MDMKRMEVWVLKGGWKDGSVQGTMLSRNREQEAHFSPLAENMLD